SGRGRGFERTRHLFGAVALDHVPNLEVIVILDAKAALESFTHFAHVVLEALERRERPVEYLDAVADDADAPLAIDHAAANRAARDRADARDLEYLAHLG